MNVDVLLIGAGIAVLGCVMAFLMFRPGRRPRAAIDAMLHRSGPNIQLPDHCIFISYRRSDSTDIVGRLYEHLTSRHGAKAVFKDVDTLVPGDDFRLQIEQSLKACRVFLCIMGDQWAGPLEGQARKIDNPGDFVRIEVETALRRGIPVIPVLVRGMSMPPADFFPDSLKELSYRHGLVLRSDPDFSHDAARLMTSIATHVEGCQGSSPAH
jgi:hypothetical protein